MTRSLDAVHSPTHPYGSSVRFGGLMSGSIDSAHRSLADAGLCSGIYYLHAGGRVVYVGKAKVICERIGAHQREGRIQFDAVSWTERSVAELNDFEASEIRRLCPQFNKAFNTPPVSTYLDPLQRYNVHEACALLRCSRGHLYKMIKEGKIRLIKDGRRSFVPGSTIVALSSGGSI